MLEEINANLNYICCGRKIKFRRFFPVFHPFILPEKNNNGRNNGTKLAKVSHTSDDGKYHGNGAETKTPETAENACCSCGVGAIGPPGPPGPDGENGLSFASI